MGDAKRKQDAKAKEEPFGERVAAVKAYMEQMGVGFRVEPVRLSTGVFVPDVQAVDTRTEG